MRILDAISKQWSGIERRTLRRNLYGLEKCGMIKRLKKKNKITFFVLTKSGKEELAVKKQKEKNIKWDKKWRIVIFDIPEEEKAKRDRFRRRLVGLGFVELQHSAWIYSYECYEDIHEAASSLEATDYLSYIVAESVSKEKLLKKRFNL